LESISGLLNSLKIPSLSTFVVPSSFYTDFFTAVETLDIEIYCPPSSHSEPEFASKIKERCVFYWSGRDLYDELQCRRKVQSTKNESKDDCSFTPFDYLSRFA
jgi:hypothetical protein